ncbi:MAG: thioesterase family protein [Erythrobacter sp.]|uniref:thioesterase family protein n=1 Tax=Erythrobacter sp. TaxID=1042 RepID=UPI0026153F47|nr:thioesterase family protein [Erythrobacter sp.]MDJ0978803.1 thioesterase family protein [Erythrobacter sp.]
MSDYPLDLATELEPVGETRLKSSAGEAYWNFTSAFGGWALALGYSAVQKASPQTGALASAVASFLKPLPESGLMIDVRALREGRRTNFMRAEFASEDTPDTPVFTADYVFSDMKMKELDYTCDFPDVKAPEDAARLPDNPGPKFLSRYEQRVALGQPFSAQERPHSAFWVRDAADRPWDAKALLALSDTPMPRTFFVDPTPRFGSTVQYDLHVMCGADDLAACGSDYLLVEASSDRVFSGRFSQVTRIWSREKRLLAISNQLAFY